MANDSETTVQKYYNGKSIFITGGSGFMGKVKFLINLSRITYLFITFACAGVD